MAIQFVNNVDFNANQAQSIRIENVATDPSTELVIGRIIFNTAADTLKQYVADAGSGSPGWVEVGSSSGVETFTNANGTFVSCSTVNTNAIGDVTIGTIDLSAAGTPDATKYLRGDNTWSAISGIYAWDIAGDTGSETIVNGDTVNFTGGTYITTAYATSTNELSITHNATTRNDTTSSDTPGYGGTFQAVTGVTTNSTGHVTAIDVSTVTMPSAENYTWTVAGSTGSSSVASGTTITWEGGTNITTAYNANVVTIDLDNSITLSGTLGVTGATTLGAVDILGDVDMNNGKINNLGNGTASSDAVNLGQLQSAVAGVGLFKGGYNASTNSPAIAGSSNIALDQGDFYVVTTDGTITFSDTTVDVEVGDLIFANGSISANSNPASTAYTIVIQDQNIAGEGATDGATEKGVAGFNSAHFSVTANGWVSADIYGGGSTLGIVPSGGSATTFLRGDGTWVTPTDTGAKGDRVSLTNGSTAGGVTTFTYNVTNSFSGAAAQDVKCEVISSAGQTVYADVTRSSSNLVVAFTGTVADNAYQVLLTYVG